MRQLGTLATQTDAERFTDYLVAQGIDARAEADGPAWAVWVRDENQIEQARAEFRQFRESPADPRYSGHSRAAAEMRRQEALLRQRAQQNQIEMRQRWGTGTARHAPLTVVLIGLAVGVVLFAGFMTERSPAVKRLSFVEPAKTREELAEAGGAWKEIKRGQLWRLVTPAFLHANWQHLIFNVMMLHLLGTQIEHVRGTWRFAGLALLLAVASNVGQAIVYPYFGGLSGVNYGLLGYVWMRSAYVPNSGFVLRMPAVVLAMIWFFVGVAELVPNIANAAHFVGLATGMLIGYWPRWAKGL